MSVEGAALTHGSVGGHLFRQTLPMVGGIFAIMSVGLIDAYYIGLLGDQPLTAVSFIFPVIIALSSLGVGVIAGIASVVSRALGKGDNVRAQSLAGFGLILATIFGVFVSTLLLWSKSSLFELMNASANLLPLIDAYMTPFALGFPLLLINMAGNGTLRGQGLAGKASLILVAMAVTNWILDPLLIHGVGSFEGYGIRGAAYATIVGWAVASIVSLIFVQRSQLKLSLTSLKAAKPLSDVKSLLSVGGPAAFSNSVNPMGLSILTAFLAQYGDAAVAGFGAGGRLQSFAVVPLLALSSSIGGIVGQNWGAGYADRARSALWLALAFCVFYGVVAGIVLCVWRESLAGLFTDSPEIIAALSAYLVISVWGYAGYGALIVVNGALNAIDRASVALLQSIVRVALFMIPLAWGFGFLLQAHSVYWGELLANILGGVLALIIGRAMLADRFAPPVSKRSAI
ncbi:MAG: MATE family efflux transporter [Oleibacter sp.]|nr:MATE family efflux transporter [Thalassolituus sp.]